MITLNIDLTTTSESKPFDFENIEETIGIVEFENFIKFIVYVMEELNPRDEKVYIIAYGDDEDGIVFVDHLTGNIIDHLQSQFKDIYDVCIEQGYSENTNVFLFASDTYEEAYDLAKDMKEQTGMVWKWQLEGNLTIDNKGIKITSNAN